MKFTIYKSLSLLPLLLGATVFAVDSAGDAERAPASAADPIVSVNIPAAQAGIDTDIEVFTASAGTRTTMLREVEDQLNADAATIDPLRERSAELSGDVSSLIAAAEADLSAKEGALRSSVNEARSASAEAQVGEQTNLNSDYDAFLTAAEEYQALFPADFVAKVTAEAAAQPAEMVAEVKDPSLKIETHEQVSVEADDPVPEVTDADRARGQEIESILSRPEMQ